MIGQQMVNAFVVSRDDSTETFYAYCNSIGRDLIIDKHFVFVHWFFKYNTIALIFRPPDVDILGKWIKVLVCHENKVCQNVLVIDDLYECRVMQGLPEVWIFVLLFFLNSFFQIKVDIEHVSRFEDKFEMFHHNFFGFICDVRNVIKVVEHAVSYNVWIVRHREPGTNSRWRVSVKQDNVVSINFHVSLSAMNFNFSQLKWVFFRTINLISEWLKELFTATTQKVLDIQHGRNQSPHIEFS